MLTKAFQLLIFLASVIFAYVSASHESDLLKTTDISRVMHQIMQAHAGEKEVTDQILRHALVTYISQFDPDKIYFLEGEIAEFKNLTSQQLNEAIQSYKQNDFNLFKKLNKIIQFSIERARKIRYSLLYKNGTLSFHPPADLPQGPFSSFAQTDNELRQRILASIQQYIEHQKARYGEVMSTQKKEQILQSYEWQRRGFENQYLYQNEAGNPLPADEQENLFVLHVLKALAKSLDVHTSFYDANEAYDIRVRLQKEFKGFGLVLKDAAEGPTIESLLTGSPAANNGTIQKGDILIEINREPLTNTPFDKVIEQLHQGKESTVQLKFKRKGKTEAAESTYEVELKKEKIVLNQDRAEISSIPFANGIIGIITLPSFYQGDDISSEKDVREAIEKLEGIGTLRGLILDLRDNTGGFLSQAIKVAGLFITDGVIVISKYADGSIKYYRDVDNRRMYEGPLVVLTSKMTASAAEIVAQALQDYGVALVVGDEHTYGKGTIQMQNVTDHQSTSYFKVTIGKYYTVSGKTPQKTGVLADIVVPGHWNNQSLGEAVDSDEGAESMAPAFEDSLEDVSPESRGWYLKYYVPHLQHRIMIWRDLLPILKKNNDYRIAHSKNYQLFLTGKAPRETNEEESEESDQDKSTGETDLQLQETVNVVRDMIILHSLGGSVSSPENKK